MHDSAIFILGAAGTTLSVVSLIPQVLKTWRMRRADDISAGWLIFALLSMLVWVIYGTAAGAAAIAWANALTFVQVGFILAVKWGFGRRLLPPATAPLASARPAAAETAGDAA
jgi:MtN3 and saliva related transmembrane protein